MEGLYLENKVKEHDKKLREVDQELEDHREQLLKLKENDEKFQADVAILKTDLAKLQTGQSSLELTVMKGNQGTQTLIEESKEISTKLLDHVLGKSAQETQAQIDIKKQRWEIIGKVSVLLVGSGGLIAVVIQAII